MSTSGPPRDALVLSIVSAIGQVLDDRAFVVVHHLARALVTALAQTARISGEIPPLGFFVSIVGARADWSEAEELAHVAMRAASSTLHLPPGLALARKAL